MPSVAGPVRDDYFLDAASTTAPSASASAGRDLEWPQIAFGFGAGVLLVMSLLLAVRVTRLRQPVH